MNAISTTAPLTLHHARVLSEWIDYNGHMMDGYYAVAFSHAIDAFMDFVGMDAAYRAATHCTIYNAEMHIVYLRELKQDAPLRFTTQLLGHDAKRIHLFHALYHDMEPYLAATCETMLLHVDQTEARVVPLPPDILARVARIAAAHAALPRPLQAGRTINMVSRKAI